MLEYLLKLLWTYKVYEYNFQNIHWQARGGINLCVHTKSQEHYEYAQESIDEIAERIMQLEWIIPMAMCELVEKSAIQFLSTCPDMEWVVRDMLATQSSMIDFLKGWIKQSTEDYWTEDLLRKLCAWHEKQRWLIGTLFPKKSTNEKPDPESIKKD